MKKRLLVAAAVIILLVAAVGWHLWGPSRVPAGQPPLTTLDSTNLTILQDAFNEASNQVRVIVLLSPT